MENRTKGEVRVQVALPFPYGDQLSKSMYAARGALSPLGVRVPRPTAYRDTITRHIRNRNRNGMPMMPRERDIMWEALGGADFETLFLSFTSLLARPAAIVDQEGLLPELPGNLSALRHCLDGARIHLLLNVRDPGALMSHVIQAGTAGGLTPGGAASRRLYWSDLVDRIRRTIPGISITVWSDEDAPLVWPKALRAAGGLGPEKGVPGALDMARPMMSPEGRERLDTHLRDNPPRSEAALIRTMHEFLDAFVDRDRLDSPVDLPGWTQEVIDAFAEVYEEDIEEIREKDGVTLLTP